MSGTVVLGAGMSGLGAALALGAPAYEAGARPGGVCHSYYVDAGGAERDPTRDDASDCFRFEPAGGHWMFGPEARTLERFGRHATFRRYTRTAAVWFAGDGAIVPFPVQEHLRAFAEPLRRRILDEILAPPRPGNVVTFEDWLLHHFGPTLCERFFWPFNRRYTAGLSGSIAPQDAYKSPIDRARIVAGAEHDAPSAGYNATFLYPQGGLDRLVCALAATAEIHVDHRVVHVDPAPRTIGFAGGAERAYTRLVSSIPLDRMAVLCGVTTAAPQDPATAVLVVNVAAPIGPACPPHHWIYVPDAASGLHRVGFYSNVDRGFLPGGSRGLVSLYAERSYPAQRRPDDAALADAARAIVGELQAWGFIREPIVVRTSYTDPAYTWSWPGSTWADDVRRALRGSGIEPIGRYGNWRFQGMADSFEQGWATRTQE